ncbi:unnamed protein product, partial [Linum tenue]
PFPKPFAGFHIAEFLRRINHSLSHTLTHFYPLAGRLVTSDSPHDDGSYVVSIDCANSPGARLIHAVADLTISDVLSPTYVPVVVQSFFDHDRAINHDGHTMSLVTIQVTELIDGVFIGCSFNHVVGDGTSFWNFLTALSETYRGKTPISRPRVNNRWFPEGCNQIIPQPADQIPSRYESPKLLERFFQFTDLDSPNFSSLVFRFSFRRKKRIERESRDRESLGGRERERRGRRIEKWRG